MVSTATGVEHDARSRCSVSAWNTRLGLDYSHTVGMAEAAAVDGAQRSGGEL